MVLALIISAYTIAFRYSWSLTLVSSSALLFIILVYTPITPILIKKQQGVVKANAKAAAIAGEIFGSIRAVCSLGAQKTLTGKHTAAVEDAKKQGLSMSVLFGTQIAPMFFSMYASIALAFWFGIKQYRDGNIESVGTLVT